MDRKDASADIALPPYTAFGEPPPPPSSSSSRGFGYRRRALRRRLRRWRLTGLAALVALALGAAYVVHGRLAAVRGGAFWTAPAPPPGALRLSAQKLEADLATCAALRRKPQDAPGAGRAQNARFVDGTPPTLIRNASVWVGEPDAAAAAAQYTEAEVRAGAGYRWIAADVYIDRGLIQRVEALADGGGGGGIDAAGLPAGVQEWDARGRALTAGIIDMHSHAGVDSLPELRGNDDTNELSDDITPYVRATDGLQPTDHQIQVIKSGGVTTSLVLPGSGNNIGGEAFVIKHAVGRRDGRPELSIASLLAAPDAPDLRYIKMACGENAKRVYGKVGEHGPYSRLGEAWEFRHAFEQAAALVQAQDDWCATAEAAAAATEASGAGPADWTRALTSYLPRALQWDTLAAVLRGQVFVNTHCYTVPDLESFVGYTNEFRFPVRAFHHAHQTFLVPEVLKRAWGADVYGPPASALFADNMYYKAESQIASEYAGRVLWDHGLTPIYVSDNPVLNAQHVLFEAAKAYRYGLPYHAALAAVTSAPAERLGLGHRLGRVKPGFDADVVVWDSDPLSVGAAPVQVWIDGRPQFDHPVELDKPVRAPAAVPDASSKPDVVPPPAPVDVDGDVVFTGLDGVLLSGYEHVSAGAGAGAGAGADGLAVAVSGGRITCVGACEDRVAAARGGAAGTRLVALDHGYLTHAFTAFGSLLGLNAIDAESSTDNGGGDVFSRAVDGLALGDTKLQVARQYGVTRAVSAPKLRGAFTHHGTSAGFLTGAATQLDPGAVFAADAAVHYTLTPAAKHGSTPSLSSAVGALRTKLLAAVADAGNRSSTGAAAAAADDTYSEAAFLRQVVAGALPLVVTAHSADVLAALLKVKAEVDAAAAATPLRLVVLGGAESHLVAADLAQAGVGVVLAPLQSYATSWDQRRALTGAPLTNGTAIDVLLDAGVVVGIGLEEDWLLRDLALLAGIAYHNGGGRLSDKQALDLVSTNIDTLLGLAAPKADAAAAHFLIHEGHPLDIRARIKAVGGGLGRLTLL